MVDFKTGILHRGNLALDLVPGVDGEWDPEVALCGYVRRLIR